MPYKDRKKQNAYMKEKMRQIREKKYKFQDDNSSVILTNKINYYEHSGKPITMTLLNGEVIYLKRRITTHI
jgi:hypothetical protein